MTVQQAIRDIVAGRSLCAERAYDIASAVMAGEATPAQIGALLVGLRMKGEAVDEILGFVRAMRARMTPVCVLSDGLVDTCGTGGDAVVTGGIPTSTFNVSTAAAFVAAGAGCRVAKHGNRAISSRCGSADVLRALGLSIEMSTEESARCIEEIGVGFLFAPRFHRSLKHTVQPRHEIGVRTILNIAGPLANPAGARRQLVGVFERRLTEALAEVLLELGSVHCMVVHGDDGLDEISITGPTCVTELRNGRTRTYTIHPSEFGLPTARLADIQGGDSKINADIATQVLSGVRGPARDIVLLNAGAAIYLSGKCDSLRDGITLAKKSIDSGSAIGKLHALRERTPEALA